MSFTNIVTQAGNIQGIVGSATNFVQSVLSLFGADQVAILDNDTFDQLFISARPVKANISRVRKVMDHPVEDGSVTSDFAVTLPSEVELSLILAGTDYAQVYKQFYQYFSTSTLLCLQLRSDTMPNMIISGMPHEESPDMMDAIPLALKFRHVQMITVQYQQLTAKNVTNVQDQSTVNTGTQQPQQSALYQIGSFLKGIF
jgi:hypothetical protein